MPSTRSSSSGAMFANPLMSTTATLSPLVTNGLPSVRIVCGRPLPEKLMTAFNPGPKVTMLPPPEKTIGP
jgi:hypothetical protein